MSDLIYQDNPELSWPLRETSQGLKVFAYNQYFEPATDISIELTCFRRKLSVEDGGKGAYGHLHRAHDLIWPYLRSTYHEWTRDRFKTFCENYKVISLAGGSGTAKSADAARYALLWWWANPENRAVLVFSTTINALLKRIWSYITEYFYKAQGQMPGIVSNSPPPKILFSKKDTKHGIHGAALKEGKGERTLADLIGIHPNEGLLCLVDEATDVVPAIEDARVNWDSGGVNFQMVVIGNSKSKLDVHGKLSKPKAGWKSINPDHDEKWETEHGVCLFSDCYKSPAILHPDHPQLRFLITKEKIQAEANRLGVNHPQFWRFVRGFWPPEDITKTVLTISMIETHHAQARAKWLGTEKVTVAALDPAYTSDGDECILRFADVGMTTAGHYAIDFGGSKNIIPLNLDSRSKEPMTYQIVRLAKAECEKRGVRPEHFGMDCWGFGAGVSDVLEKIWSPEIIRTSAIGMPSDMFVDVDRQTRASEIYDRRVTELWFMVREFMLAGQIFGLDDETCEEFCSREYDDSKRKYRLETKDEYKKRLGKGDGPTGSPDRADAAAIIIEVVRVAFGLTPGKREISISEKEEWESEWERRMGHKENGTNEEDWKAQWNADAILDSSMFENPE